MREAASEFKRCPFCGGNAKRYSDTEGVTLETMGVPPIPIYYIVCEDCPALMAGRSWDDVEALWNRRINIINLYSCGGK